MLEIIFHKKEIEVRKRQEGRRGKKGEEDRGQQREQGGKKKSADGCQMRRVKSIVRK